MHFFAFAITTEEELEKLFFFVVSCQMVHGGQHLLTPNRGNVAMFWPGSSRFVMSYCMPHTFLLQAVIH